VQRAAFDAVQAGCPREPDHAETGRGHGRVIRRSIWVTGAVCMDFPHAAQVARIRRDGYDCDGQLIGKETTVGQRPIPCLSAGLLCLEGAKTPAVVVGQCVRMVQRRCVQPDPAHTWA
jgi:hypothetical protein